MGSLFHGLACTGSKVREYIYILKRYKKKECGFYIYFMGGNVYIYFDYFVPLNPSKSISYPSSSSSSTNFFIIFYHRSIQPFIFLFLSFSSFFFLFYGTNHIIIIKKTKKKKKERRSIML